MYKRQVNTSQLEYVQKDQSILLPLQVINNISAKIAMSIIEERDNGLYKDYHDFVARVSLSKTPRNVIESLINAGALDSMHLSRKTMLKGLDDALNYADLITVNNNEQLHLNFDIVSKPVLKIHADDKEKRIENEKEALGFSIGPHPIISIREHLNIHDPSIIQIKTAIGLVNSFAIIQNVHAHRTKKGEMMAFLKVGDETGEMEMAVMPRLYQQVQQDLVKGAYIRFHGKISQDGSCIAESIQRVK